MARERVVELEHGFRAKEERKNEIAGGDTRQATRSSAPDTSAPRRRPGYSELTHGCL